MTKKIIANWKMNGNISMLDIFCKYFDNEKIKNDLILCPPTPLIYSMSRNIRNPKVSLGAQDCSYLSSGNHTGEIALSLLKEIGCSYLIVAHAERRRFDTIEDIIKKIKISIQENIIPIICIQNSDIEEESEILQYCKTIYKEKIIIAYEPISAIGGGISMDVNLIVKMVQKIKNIIHHSIPVFYGGSVNEKNANEIINVVDGLLVGKASLDIVQLSKIVNS